MALLTCRTCSRILDENEFYPKGKSTNRRSPHCRKCDNRTKGERIRRAVAAAKVDKNNWGFASCIHIPYEHPDYLDWLEAVRDAFNIENWVFLGDLLDFGALNRFQKNPNLPSPLQEYSAAIPKLERLYEVFPKAFFVVGNHDERVLARAGEAYLPDIFIKGLDEVLMLPEGWEQCGDAFEFEHNICGRVRVEHGDRVAQRALTNAMALGRNFVMGDRHTTCGVNRQQTKIDGHGFWGINTGCLIDADREAYIYSRKRNKKPVLAIGAIVKGTPMNIYMEVDNTGRWIGKKQFG